MLSRSSSAYQPLGGASDNSRHRHDHTEARPIFFVNFVKLLLFSCFPTTSCLLKRWNMLDKVWVKLFLLPGFWPSPQPRPPPNFIETSHWSLKSWIILWRRESLLFPPPTTYHKFVKLASSQVLESDLTGLLCWILKPQFLNHNQITSSFFSKEFVYWEWQVTR